MVKTTACPSQDQLERLLRGQLPEHEAEVPASVLVYFHNHSDSGLPVVIVPDHNIMNRWHFHGAGTPFRGLSWADTLVKLPSEGFYMLRKQLDFDGGSWPKATLVQLGYTKTGDPILFIAQQRGAMDENDLFFSDRGVGIRQDQLAMLEVLKGAGFKSFRPGGAYYIMADISGFGYADDMQFIRHLIEDVGVAAVPGSSFFENPSEGSQLIRFCFCKKYETLKVAQERLSKI